MKKLLSRKRLATALVGVALIAFTPFTFAANASSQDKDNAIVLGIDPASPPFETEQDGKVVGFDVDLIHAIAKAENLNIKIRVMPWTGILTSLQSGSIDLSINGITITSERMKNVDFTNAYYRSGLSIVVKKGSKIKNFDDLEGRVIAVRKGTSSVSYLKQHDMYNPKLVKQYGSINSAYQAVLTGGADAAIYDNPMNIGFTLKHKNAEITGGLLTGEYYGIAVTKGRPGLVKKLNVGLEKVKADGTYRKLFDKYLGGDTSGLVKGVKTPEDVAVTD